MSNETIVTIEDYEAAKFAIMGSGEKWSDAAAIAVAREAIVADVEPAELDVVALVAEVRAEAAEAAKAVGGKR